MSLVFYRNITPISLVAFSVVFLCNNASATSLHKNAALKAIHVEIFVRCS